MRVYLGSDHAGYELKQHLAGVLARQGYDVVDVGPHQFDPDDDYPPFCLAAAARTVDDQGSLAVVIGGSGNGEQIAANKVAGARAALAWSVETARLAREHNNANVVGIGARMHSLAEATTIVETFLATLYPGGDRHTRRINQIAAYEQSSTLPALPTSRPTPPKRHAG